MIKPGLKPGRSHQVKWVRFCAGQLSRTCIIKMSRSDPDLMLTALLEYLNLLAHTLKVQSCYIFSYGLAR